MALGDILLEEGDSVETLTARAIRQAFAAITLSTGIPSQITVRSRKASKNKAFR